MLTKLWAIVSMSLALGCAVDEHESTRTASAHADKAAKVTQDDENEVGLNLAQSDCSIAANISKVTASPAGSLFINSPLVTGDARAKVVNGVPGKWSFAYAIREILELPAPGTNPTLLAAEQAKVLEFTGKFTQTTPVNTFVPSARTATKSTLEAAWGTTLGTDLKAYKTFDKAPFKLVAIVNRLDIVKKGKTGVTAGEGRFVYGFTGPQAMTVIFEYDLPIGLGSNNGVTDILAWTTKWQNLKTFLTDTSTAAGTQPSQVLTALNSEANFRDKAGYLAALQQITELWANRAAQVRAGGTQAAISQIRTNEILSSPWELREMIRDRDAAGKGRLTLATVKNNPDASFNNGAKNFTQWITSNVVCTGTTADTCSYNTANGQLPPAIPSSTGASVSLLAPEALENVSWFSSAARTAKTNFVALNTCSGCHTGETNTGFTHVSPVNGAPSQFLITDLGKRLTNFRNLVCLAAATTGALNLTNGSADLTSLRVGISNSTH